MKHWGLILLNLGTPDSTSTADVRRYLREFLSDPRVIDIPAPARWALLNLIILPFRPKRSAEAYEKVFTERGSPLLFHGEDLVAKVQQRLGPDVPVTLAMRYGTPSVASALGKMRKAGVDRIVFFPLFPQYSSAAWGSAVENVYEETVGRWNVPTINVVPPFFSEPGYLKTFAKIARPVIDDMQPDLVMMSFHGVPERHCTKSDDTGSHCLVKPDCCAALVEANRNCYSAQCYASARGIAAELGLADDEYEVTFQSRLGRTPWIKPYTDIRLTELAKKGVKKIAVLSPAFVADCLETLEELAIRNNADFQAAGGEELRLVPSLNSEDAWADTVVELSTRALSEGAAPTTGTR
jgi:ferrochelatase